MLQALPIEAALDDVDDLLDLERLENVVVRAVLHGLDGGFHGAEAGHDHGQDRDAELGDLFDQIEPVHLGHLEVRDDQVVAALLQLLQGLHAVLDGAYHVALQTQKVRQNLADHTLVVDHQDARAVRVEGVLEPLAYGIKLVGAFLGSAALSGSGHEMSLGIDQVYLKAARAKNSSSFSLRNGSRKSKLTPRSVTSQNS